MPKASITPVRRSPLSYTLLVDGHPSSIAASPSLSTPSPVPNGLGYTTFHSTAPTSTARCLLDGPPETCPIFSSTAEPLRVPSRAAFQVADTTTPVSEESVAPLTRVARGAPPPVSQSWRS